jgi:hypothetical protein
MILPMKMEPGTGRALVPADQQTPRFAAQLRMIFEDARLLGLSPVERQAAVKMLARLLLEAEGAAVQEVGDDTP